MPGFGRTLAAELVAAVPPREEPGVLLESYGVARDPGTYGLFSDGKVTDQPG
jgi:hypothetical protein